MTQTPGTSGNPGIPTPLPGPALPTNGKAIASLILGIVSIPVCCCPFGFIVSFLAGGAALVLGIMANKEAATGRFSPASKVMGLVGMICGGLGILLGVILLILVAIGSSPNFQQWAERQQQQLEQQQQQLEPQQQPEPPQSSGD